MLVGEEGDTDHNEKAAIYRGDLQKFVKFCVQLFRAGL